MMARNRAPLIAKGIRRAQLTPNTSELYADIHKRERTLDFTMQSDTHALFVLPALFSGSPSAVFVPRLLVLAA